MNITLFNKNHEFVLSKANLALLCKNTLMKNELFLESLNVLEDLLKNDKVNSMTEIWPISEKIVRYHEIRNIYAKIRNQNPDSLLNTWANKNILELNKQIDALKKIAEANIKLPFKIGQDRENFSNKVKLALKLVNKTKVHYVEKEFFHLLSHHLPNLYPVQKTPYEGSYKVCSLRSWKAILKDHIKAGNSDEQSLAILSQIKKSIPIALKITFAKRFFTKKNEMALEIEYFKNLSKYMQPNSTPEDLELFLQKYELSKANKIPLFVIINEIVWDILLSINELKENEENLFLLGTRSHCVAVQIYCKQSASAAGEGKYVYKIINTGCGAAAHHEFFNKSEGKMYPVIFEDVTKTGFTYSFIAKLIKLSILSDNIDDFYALHDDYLVAQAKGIKVKNKGPAYDRQKDNTCTYRCVEEVIHSKMSEEKFKQLIKSKIRVSTTKFSQAIKIIEKHQNVRLKINKKRKVDSIAYQPLAKRLRLDQSLLSCAQKYANPDS